MNAISAISTFSFKKVIKQKEIIPCVTKTSDRFQMWPHNLKSYFKQFATEGFYLFIVFRFLNLLLKDRPLITSRSWGEAGDGRKHNCPCIWYVFHMNLICIWYWKKRWGEAGDRRKHNCPCIWYVFDIYLVCIWYWKKRDQRGKGLQKLPALHNLINGLPP